MRTAPRLMGNVSHAVHNSVSSGHAGQKACTAYATKGKSKQHQRAADAQKRNHHSAASVDVAVWIRIRIRAASSLNLADPHRSSARVVAKPRGAGAGHHCFLANRWPTRKRDDERTPAAKTMTRRERGGDFGFGLHAAYEGVASRRDGAGEVSLQRALKRPDGPAERRRAPVRARVAARARG